MQYVLLTDTQVAHTQMNPLAYDVIQGALNAITGEAMVRYADQVMQLTRPADPAHDLSGITAAQWGAWVGPPRVVRANSQIGPTVLHLAGLWGFPDDAVILAHSEAMTGLLATYFSNYLHNEVSDQFTGGQVVLYNAAVNGPVDWWQSGQAAASRTRNAPDSTIATVAEENPWGPNAGATPQTATNALSQALGAPFQSIGAGLLTLAKGVAVVAGLGVLAAVGVKVYHWNGDRPASAVPRALARG
jgi:hypothetical protein